MKPKLIHICWLIVCACWHPVHSQVQNDAAWSAYGGDPGGQRYSTARQLNPTTVVDLKVAWEYHTGALDSKKAGYLSASFESTPILFADTLIFATPFDEVIAVSAETGRKRWSFDPGVVSAEGYLVTSRGVAVWTSERPGPCRDRVFFGTLDARLIALDAANGNRCSDFGKNGEVAIAPQSKIELLSPADAFSVTSPPTVIGNVVIIGSSVGDNFQARMASGSVRAFDAISGKPLWQWDPIPWAQNRAVRAGAANAWSIISADPALGLAFIPTGSASPDYFGGLRPGRNEDADSIVALQASSGKKVWSFQLVHHDLWDYDTAAQPLLFTFHGDIPRLR